MNKIKITKEEIKKLGNLSKIHLTEEEIEKFTNDMSTIISSVETLEGFEKETGIKIKDRQLNEIPFYMLREDKIEKSLDRKEVLANAPHQEDGYVKVYGDVFDQDNS